MSFSKSEIALAEAARAISTFWKTHSCKLIPNWTRNRMITYTNCTPLSSITIIYRMIGLMNDWINGRTNERINTLKSRIFSFRAIDTSIPPPPPQSRYCFQSKNNAKYISIIASPAWLQCHQQHLTATRNQVLLSFEVRSLNITKTNELKGFVISHRAVGKFIQLICSLVYVSH